MLRVRFYIGWMLAESVNNASGLGFNGYDELDNPKWDLNSNIRILDVEVKKT